MTDLSAASPEASRLQARIGTAAAIGAAGLMGFGVILWIAANWDKLDKFGKFGVVGGAFLLGALAAMARPVLRIPGSLVAFCAIGAVFALFGQVYQSGADPWQLFALWAALGLPLALASRHDAVWIPWSLVTFTGLSLWMGTLNRFFHPDLSSVLPSWAMCVLLVAVMFGISLRLSPVGQSRWAARLASLMAISLISGNAFYDVLITHSSTLIYWLGIAVLVMGTLLAARSRPLELPLLVATVLAIDVLLITGICRLLFITIGGRPDAGAFFLVFICSAAIIGGTATALLKWVGKQHEQAEATDTPVTAPVRTWPITLLSGFGAVLASIPLMVFFGMFFSEAFRSGATIYILALLLIGGSVAMLKAAKHLSFTQQLGFIGLVAGLMLLSGGMLRDVPNNLGATSGAMLVVCTGLAFFIRAGWIRSLLGAAAGICLASFLKSQLIGNNIEDLFRPQIFAAMIFAGCAAALVAALGRREETTDDRSAMLVPYASGFTASALAALIESSGKTFLLGGGSIFESATPAKMVWSLANVAPPTLGVLAALLGAALLFRTRTELRSPLAYAVTLAIMIFAAVSPMLGFTALLLAVCLSTGRNVLAIFAAIAALWIIGSFYYWLGWTLERKGLFLVALGLALGLAIMFVRRGQTPTGAEQPTPAVRPLMASGLIALTTVATGGILGTGISQKEAILSSGRVVYMQLVPVDPRSLLQGDYMALRFAMPDTADTANVIDDYGARPVAVATVDARKIAKIVEVTTKTPAPMADQVVMKMRQGRRGWSVGTDAWFFPEGQGQKFEAAKYGEFRLGPAGDLILMGMADQDLKPIK